MEVYIERAREHPALLSADLHALRTRKEVASRRVHLALRTSYIELASINIVQLLLMRAPVVFKNLTQAPLSVFFVPRRSRSSKI